LIAASAAETTTLFDEVAEMRIFFFADSFRGGIDCARHLGTLRTFATGISISRGMPDCWEQALRTLIVTSNANDKHYLKKVLLNASCR
jgi:hypothetical protein